MEIIRDCPRCELAFDDEDLFVGHLEAHEWTSRSLTLDYHGHKCTIVGRKVQGKWLYECPLCDESMKGPVVYWHLDDVHRELLVEWKKEELQETSESPRSEKRPRMYLQDHPSSDSTLVHSSPSPPPTAKVDEKPRPFSERFTYAKAMRNIPPPPPIVNFKINTAAVFRPEHNTSTKVFDFIAHNMENLVMNCAAHGILKCPSQLSHVQVNKCDLPIGRDDSHYRLYFSPMFNAPTGTCWYCYTPIGYELAFQHATKCNRGTKGGGTTDRVEYEDWWKGIAYLVWRVPEICAIVFSYLGIPAGLLDETLEWTQWLALPVVARNVNNRFSDRRLVNYVAVAYAYLHLRASGQIVIPEDGFYITGDDPIITSIPLTNLRGQQEREKFPSEAYRKYLDC